ncbi:RNB domain-containing ribonuclease [Propionicimonas sp.]|uniref:RNB domain-containing ribonuclease n=1 Tax=Propionicimonas sp. TaxID=1955623 RepID=UPI0039E25A6D
MPSRYVSLQTSEPPALREGLRRLRATLGVPAQFPPDVLAEAAHAAANPVLPTTDRTDIEFVTLDPEGSTDLDQAFHLARTGTGFRLLYAIADVAAFVSPGGHLDTEAHSRGETLYSPTRKTPLHPSVLSEGAASLLPDQLRPALVWELEFDADGQTTSTRVARGLVRSRAKLSYVGAQAALDAGTGGEQLELLRTLGTLRLDLEAARGGVSLSVPEQEVVATKDRWALQFRAPLPVEDWNAQLSLATGMGAASLMLAGGVGILRTLPPARDGSLAKLRRTAAALGIRWPPSQGYPAFVRSLDASVPAQAAMLNACTTLFRGAGYQAFRGTIPSQPLHAAIAAPYAHTTAPLRRLVDRYCGEICVAISAGVEVPDWVTSTMAELPPAMDDADRRSKKYERGIVDLVEALVLAPRLGQSFSGTVLEVDPEDDLGVLQLPDPAVEAKVKGADLVLGEQVSATLVSADLLSGKVEFRILDPA